MVYVLLNNYIIMNAHFQAMLPIEVLLELEKLRGDFPKGKFYAKILKLGIQVYKDKYSING